MNGLGLLVRGSLRAHRRSIIGLALVVALAGGLSLTTFAAARRTASAFTRFLAASDASDLAIGLFPEGGLDTPGDYIAETDPILEAARSIPGVERDSTHLGLTTMYVAGPDGRAAPDTPEIIGSLEGRFLETDRVTVLQGRVPDADRPDEVIVNTAAVERYDMQLGSRHELVTIAGGDEVFDARGAEVIGSTSVRVVGVGRFPEEVLRDEYDVDGFLLTTPALTRRYLEQGFPYRFHALHLAAGTNPSEVVAAYEALSGEDYGLIVQRTDAQRTGAQLALRPIVVALAVFGGLAAAAALALGALGAARLSSAAGADVPVLRAVGASRAAIAMTVGAPALAGLAVGAVGAVALAVALSPLAPIGPVREVEPGRGVDLDATAVLGGAGVLLAVLVLAALAGAALVARHRGRAIERPARRSVLRSALAALDLSPAVSVGVREGVGVGGSRAGTAVRSTLASCTLSVVAVVATLTFSASIDGLLDTPDRYGWAADRALVAGAGYITIPPEAVEPLAALPDVRSVALASYGLVQLGGRTVSAMGLEAATGPTAVTVLAGRLPLTDDEVALGVNTARELAVGVGDAINDPDGEVTVVGIAAMPAIGLAGVSHPSMAQGAVLTPTGVSSRNGSAFPAVAFVDFVEGIDPGAATERARQALGEGLRFPADAIEPYDALRPAELVDVEPAKTTALALAASLAAAAILALAFTLSSSVRRRGSQLAILSALGFDRRDLRRSVRWQTACLVGAALLAGVPLGIVAGRLSWAAFADQIGVSPTPVVPLLLVAAAAVAIALVAVAVGEHPARAAARTHPGAALRPLA